MINHRAAEVGFRNVYDANCFLNAVEQNKEAGLETSIDGREISVRGVVIDWPDSILEFWEAVSEKEEILKIEKMITKKWNNIEKEYSQYDTGNLIITFRGNKLPERLWMWEHAVTISVRPYIPAVRQCFKCLRYGHIKALCKSEERCLICGEPSHGRCERPKKCRNCEGEHKSTDKKCSTYEWNKNIATIKAYNNVLYREAVLILKGKEDSQKMSGYNRYEEVNGQVYRKVEEKARIFKTETPEKRDRVRNPVGELSTQDWTRVGLHPVKKIENIQED